MYRCARASSVSSVPKNIRSGRSKRMSPTHASAARMTEPMTAAVKYWSSSPSALMPLPRFVLKITLPPMPMRRPML